MGTQKRWLESGKVVGVCYGLAGCIGQACSQVSPLLPLESGSWCRDQNFSISKVPDMEASRIQNKLNLVV